MLSVAVAVGVVVVALVALGRGGPIGSASRPLEGRVPGAITPGSLAGYNYTIRVTPGDTSLQAGGSGWDSWIVYSKPGTRGYVGEGASLPTTPIFGAGGGPIFGGGTGPTSFARGNAVAWVLTGPQVWAVRIGSRTIRTISSPNLPSGDRVAVFLVPAKGPFPVPPGIPLGPPRGKHPAGMKNIHTVRIVALDRSGQVIPTQITRGPDEAPPLTWLAPDAVRCWWPLQGFGTPYQGPGYHAPARPRPGVCQLAQHGLPALHAQFGHTVAWIAPITDALGEEFLSCVDAEYYLKGWPLQVGVLLDGHQPGQTLGPIPGALPISGQPEMVDLPTGQFPSSLFTRNFGVTAKRVGNAWLVAQGGSGLAQRVQVLNALRISKLDLHHLTSRRASPRQELRIGRTTK
jgi:hypothetical protein